MNPSNINTDAERSLIGAVLIDNSILFEAVKYIESKMFYDRENKKIWDVITWMYGKKEAIDLVTVTHGLRKEYGDEGNFQDYLKSCQDILPYTSHAQDYIKIIMTCYYDREICTAASVLSQEQTNENLKKLSMLVSQKECCMSQRTFKYSNDISRVSDSIFSNTGKQGRIYSKMPPLDTFMGGIRPGQVSTWGAATGIGKSIMLLNLMHSYASNGTKCLLIGTEMTAIETLRRHIAVKAKMLPYKINEAQVSMDDCKKINDGLAELSLLPIDILENPEPSINDIAAAIESTKAQVVFIDYLQRCSLPQAESMRLKVNAFMIALKTLAVRSSKIIHLASQLSRVAYNKEGTRPTLADLSESSAVEKESDRVILMWYPPSVLQIPNAKIIECILAKNRHGKSNIAWNFIMDESNLSICEHR